MVSKSFPRFACELNYLRRYHHYEADLWLIPRFCKSEENVVDIGVNMGIFSRWMAKHAKHVHGFECNPVLYSHLEKFLPNNVTLHRYALSNFSGTVQLRFDPNNTGIGTIELANKLNQNSGIRSVSAVEVKTRRLDDFEIRDVSFIKIDVEGHELEVLKGARKVLERDHPALLVEIEERHCPGNLITVPNWLANLGYRPWVLDNGGELIPAADLVAYGKNGRNNFWFRVPNDKAKLL